MKAKTKKAQKDSNNLKTEANKIVRDLECRYFIGKNLIVRTHAAYMNNAVSRGMRWCRYGGRSHVEVWVGDTLVCQVTPKSVSFQGDISATKMKDGGPKHDAAKAA